MTPQEINTALAERLDLIDRVAWSLKGDAKRRVMVERKNIMKALIQLNPIENTMSDDALLLALTE